VTPPLRRLFRQADDLPQPLRQGRAFRQRAGQIGDLQDQRRAPFLARCVQVIGHLPGQAFGQENYAHAGRSPRPGQELAGVIGIGGRCPRQSRQLKGQQAVGVGNDEEAEVGNDAYSLFQ
jgi:hypothetical protein